MLSDSHLRSLLSMTPFIPLLLVPTGPLAQPWAHRGPSDYVPAPSQLVSTYSSLWDLLDKATPP